MVSFRALWYSLMTFMYIHTATAAYWHYTFSFVCFQCYGHRVGKDAVRYSPFLSYLYVLMS